MKIFGHPIHFMLIHFPSALFPMDLACSALANYTGAAPLLSASYYALIGGVMLGWLAIVAGTFDLLTVLKNKPGSMKKALIHGAIHTTVLLAYTVLAFLAYKKHATAPGDSPLILAAKTILICLLVSGNFIGGSLVLKDRVLDKY
jgi:uncharacterized membrane protein